MELESSLKCDLKKHDQEKEELKGPRLHATYAVLIALRTCSSPDVLLPGLLHKFYRLQIQIIYRFAKWASNLISVCSDFDSQIDYASLVDLYHDLHFISSEIDHLVYEKVLEKVAVLGQVDSTVFQQANAEAQKRILEPTNNIRQHVQAFLSSKCTPAIKSVTDIPRQYRRTNRAPPSEPSTYVKQLYQPISDFCEKCPKMECWIISVFETIGTEYSKTIAEVLEASRKMEVSLLKLQQMRKTKNTDKDGKMTDDEKIRQQIKIDVTTFGSQFTTLGIDPENTVYKNLFELATTT